jgi:uncharacterized membrane protein YkoI
MNRTLKIGTGIAVGAAAVAVAGMMAVASPAPTSLVTDDPTPSTSAGAQQDAAGTKGGHAGETPLTGDKADQATAAAKKAVEGGTVIRVETDAEGTYEAHVRKADGTEVVVTMNSSFAVTGVEEFTGRGGRGGGHRGGPGAGETPLTGDNASKATAAAKAKFPDGTVIRVETDSDGTYEAHVRKADGTEVEVKMDKDFTVTTVEEFTGRGGRGHDADGTDDGATGSGTPSA